MRGGVVAFGVAVMLVLTTAGTASAASSVPLGFTDSLVASVPSPTGLAATPDGRILVTEQPGRLRVVQNGQLLANPALDLTAKICSDVERGLESVTPDPSFATNHFIYVYYTFKKSGSCPIKTSNVPVNRVSRFVLPASNIVDGASEVVLIDNIPNYAGIHNGGDLHFGKDGFLYVSVGDGGCDFAGNHACGSQNNVARDKSVLLGKILRITAGGGIPSENPYTGNLSARCNTGADSLGRNCQEIFAIGLRNPFRFAFDPNASDSRFYINDVGEFTWEEIDLGQVGADYGWNIREGHCAAYSQTNCGPPPNGMTNPIFDYLHSDGGCNAVTAAAFVPDGSGWPPSFSGAYLFGDYTCGEIFRLDQQGGIYAMKPIFTGLGGGGPVDMAFVPFGSGVALYYTTYGGNGGQLRRIAFASDGIPVASMTATPDSGPNPLSVTFDGSASADPDEDPLTYHWTFGDGAEDTTTSATALHTYTVNGTYTSSLRVEDPAGHLSPPSPSVVITVGNSRPVPSISSPAVGATFAVGQTIVLSGSATDPEDGVLGASRLSWTVLRHHYDHTHPYFGPTSGNNLSVQGPTPEDLYATTTSYLEVYLTATDSAGLSTTVGMTMQPHTVALTFATKPTGRQVMVQQFTYYAPVTVTSWEAWSITIRAIEAGRYHFLSWSDGGAKKHVIVTPATPTTYTAKYLKV